MVWFQVSLMTESFSFIILSQVLGGLAIFLLGMKYMSEGMQAIAGDKLRKLIHAVTDHRIIACGVGFAVTCIVQSSSVTTVMAVGMVNAGLMTLTQAIGVILGADIGTTITAWIVALDVFVKGGVLVFGLPILGLSGFFYLFSKNEKIRFAAMMAMGVGMVFFGLDLMKDGVKPLRTMPEFQEWFSKFTPDTLMGVLSCVVMGAILTAIVQSSSATVGITMVLASDGVINFETAVALVVGENIGTTVTAYLASLGATRNAKRSAYAHILVKFCGAVWAIPVLWLGMDWVKVFLDQYPVMVGVAGFHTSFNILNVLLFLPLVKVLSVGLSRVFPDRAVPEAVPHLTYLDIRLLETPAIGIQQSQDEILRMADKVDIMFATLGEVLREPAIDETRAKVIFDCEEELDIYQREIVMFLSKLLAGSVPLDVMERGRKQLRMADEYESISDYLLRILKMHRKLQRNGGSLSQESLAKVLDLHERVAAYVAEVRQCVVSGHMDLERAKSDADEITETMKDYRDKFLEEFAAKESTPLASLVFTDSLTAYRRVRSHALNVAQTVVGEK